VRHGAPLDLVGELVDRRLMGGRRRVAAQGLAVDHERHLGDVRRLRAAVVLDRELEHGLRAVVGSVAGLARLAQEAFDPIELALGVLADADRDVDVLALDDRPHENLPLVGAAFGMEQRRSRF
jgi:hypothetical protein